MARLRTFRSPPIDITGPMQHKFRAAKNADMMI